ncbi:hypothetical protein BB561_001126 [Smittium simulii]|uniref:Chitin-binding type-4 domain-containing protein n=1 Tax=Smittium simulii TaxID=133385 RepID=A0A2T9YW53_9FUNG|nr:hypothetical protein BB561_001126 [Smittium simulii]
MYLSKPVLLSLLASFCAGHGMMSFPVPRGNKKWGGTCAAGAGCKGPCDDVRANSLTNNPYHLPHTIGRGEELTVKWSRLNHPGGFVRLAMVPIDNSDSWDSFNNNVLKYTCYETNCGPQDPKDTKFGPLSGPGDSECSTKLSIPTNLPDGLFTLQFIWYGGGIYYGQVDTSFGEFYSCSDIKIQGGSPPSSQKSAPAFVGGDIMYPTENVCRYWGSNKVGDCNFGSQQPSPKNGDILSESLEPCMKGPPKKGVPSELLSFYTYQPDPNASK